MHAVLGVQNRDTGCGSIRGGGGGHDYSRPVQLARSKLCGIETFAAAKADNNIAAGALSLFFDQVDVLPAGFPGKGHVFKALAGLGICVGELIIHERQHAAVNDKERFLTILRGEHREVHQLTGTLDIFLRTSEGS